MQSKQYNEMLKSMAAFSFPAFVAVIASGVALTNAVKAEKDAVKPFSVSYIKDIVLGDMISAAYYVIGVDKKVARNEILSINNFFKGIDKNLDTLPGPFWAKSKVEDVVERFKSGDSVPESFKIVVESAKVSSYSTQEERTKKIRKDLALVLDFYVRVLCVAATADNKLSQTEYDAIVAYIGKCIAYAKKETGVAVTISEETSKTILYSIGSNLA